MPNEPDSFTPSVWRAAMIEYIAAHPDRPLKPRALARTLDVPGECYAAYRALVREMLDDGTLELGAGRALKLSKRPDTFTGIFRHHRRGFGFVEVAGRPDLFIPRHKTGDALDGDTVKVKLMKRRRRDEDPAAEIVSIVERAPTNWVGILERSGRVWIVRPIGDAPAPEVTIKDPTAKNAKQGDMVVVEPLDEKLNAHSVPGVIVEVLGEPSQSKTKILAVARRYALPDRFERKVRDEARRVVTGFDESAWKDREDLRGLLTITIDPDDARDFDDAISITAKPDGTTELGVHIADVSAFVLPGSALDKEALLRGNSTYFPGYVVPMLPESLSNGLCSLQPDQPRLTKSAFITYDEQAHVSEARFANSVIQSGMRLTYNEVTAFLEGRNRDLPKPIGDLLRAAESLAQAIRKRRTADGMLVLSLPEVEIELGADGNIVNAGPADTSFSHTLIEMFMVEANEAVCRLLNQIGLPHMRRIHPDPEPDTLERIGPMLTAIGYPVPANWDHATIQKLLDRARGRPEESAVSFLLLRSLAQAFYSPMHLGHFALASRHYCHFTSPIRRYADLVIHRLLDHVIAHRRPAEPGHTAAEGMGEQELADIGRAISATERRSQQAERDAKQWLLLDLMKDKIGETFDGVITGTAPIGAFVQVRPYMAEGFVPASDFGADDWEFDDAARRFIGRRGNRVINVGQPCRVRVVSVDEFAQQLMLIPESPDTLGRKRQSGKKPGGTGKTEKRRSTKRSPKRHGRSRR